jgi:hypothetical protein
VDRGVGLLDETHRAATGGRARVKAPDPKPSNVADELHICIEMLMADWAWWSRSTH